MKPHVSAILCVGALSATGPVFAAPNGNMPPVCAESARAKMAYSTGLQSGKSLVERAWLSVADCGQLGYFSSVVRDNINAYALQGASTYSICRYTGMVDGAYQELDTVWTSCGGACCWEGQVIGELAWDVYCQLSELLGGLDIPADFVPKPVTTCTGFSPCCDEVFMDTTQVQCADYTTQPFYAVWQDSATLQCNG